VWPWSSHADAKQEFSVVLMGGRGVGPRVFVKALQPGETTASLDPSLTNPQLLMELAKI
jgi:hypothetical protein